MKIPWWAALLSIPVLGMGVVAITLLTLLLVEALDVTWGKRRCSACGIRKRVQDPMGMQSHKEQRHPNLDIEWHTRAEHQKAKDLQNAMEAWSAHNGG